MLFRFEFILFYLIVLVRHKVKEIVEFIQDDDRLRDERKKAKANRDKYIGVGSDSSTSRYSRSTRISFRHHSSFFFVR